MVAPLLIGSLLAGGGWLAGKSASGGGVDLLSGFEIGTTKKSFQYTDSRQTTNTNVYAPTINRTFDIQYNIASEGSSISTKKEQAITQQPTVSPQVTPTLLVVPTTQQGAGEIGGSGSSGSAGFDYMTLVVLGGLGLGAYYLLKGGKKRK